MVDKSRNPVSELTKTIGTGDIFWLRILAYVAFVIFVLFFVIIVWMYIF